MISNSRLLYAALTGIFLLVMLGMRQVVHAAVAAGPLPWLALMGGIFWLGIYLENRGRAADGRPPYSLAEARELILPLCAGAAVLAVSFWFS